MIRVKKCPMCECESLKLLKRHLFILPEIEECDDLIDSVTYEYERLQMFFEKIWRDETPAEIDADLCTSCGMIFTNPRFTAEEIDIKYKAVSELGSAKKRYQAKPAQKTDKRAKRIYSLISGLQENTSKSRKILDYGGAYGHNLRSFIEAGELCYLLDYVKHDHPKGIEYLGKDVKDLQANEVFDVILACHVLEHAIEPGRMVDDLSSHLAEDGLLYVEVPLGCFRAWKMLGEPLTHVNFFSEESMFKCFSNADLGIVHLSTAHQWLTHGKRWCVNIVGKKAKGNTVTKFKTTQQQLENPYYNWRRLSTDVSHNPGHYLKGLVTGRYLKKLVRKGHPNDAQRGG